MTNDINNIALTDREGFFAQIIENAPVGVVVFNNEWKIEFVNENFTKFGILYNFDLSDKQGINILEEDLFPNINLSEDLIQLKSGIGFEKEIKNLQTKDAGLISVIVKGSPIFSEEKFLGGILVVEDIKVLTQVVENKPFSSTHLEKIISRTNDFLFITDAEGKLVFSLGKKIHKLNLYVDEYRTQTIDKIFTPSAREEFLKELEIVKLKRRSSKINLQLNIGTEKFEYECRIEPLLNRRGKIQHIFFFLNDITELVSESRLLEKQLNELKQYQIISENISDAIFVIDLNGKIIFWNKSSEELFGLSKSKVFNKYFGRVLGLADLEEFNKIKLDVKNDKNFIKQFELILETGERKVLNAEFSLITESNDAIIVVCKDITEKHLEEVSIKESEEKFRNIVTQAEELICTLDNDGCILYANPSFTKILKYSEEELVDRNFIDLLEPNYLKSGEFKLNETSIDSSITLEIPLKSKDGKIIWFLSKITPVLSNNTIINYNCFFTDITGKREVEKQIILFKSLVENANDGIAVESNSKIIFANPAFLNLFGISDNNLALNTNFLSFVTEKDKLKFSNFINDLLIKKIPSDRVEFLANRQDNYSFYAEGSLSSFQIENSDYLLMIVRDITEKKRSQEAIKDSEEKYRNITENIDDFLYTIEKINNKLRPVFYTSSVEKVTGYTQADFLNDLRLFVKIVYPDDFLQFKKNLQKLLKSKIQLSGELEFRIINKHGNIVWVRNKINIVRNSSGEVIKIFGLVSDITLRKKAEEELQRTTANLVKLNETKDRFISIISHDLRTPFSSILGFTELILNSKKLDEDETRQYIGYIRESSQSMLGLVNSLLDWTRLQTGRIQFEPERVCATEIINAAIKSVSGAAIKKNITVKSNLSEEIYIYADKNLILQVFNNLLSNAIKFTKENGKIEISAKRSDNFKAYEFSVKDNGLGIKEENLNKLFRVDTKFTSEGTAGEKGSGLGLSLVKEIIEKHNGKIWVESVYGSGSNFKFLLPIASPNILLVDHNNTDRILYSKILKNIIPDYKVEIAKDGKEALEKILNSPPALIITENLMPNINGYNLILELKKMELKIKPQVIVLSSQLDRNTVADYESLGISYVFKKPVNLSNFKQAVEKSLKKALSTN